MIPEVLMSSAANHLWQSTVFAGVAAVLALALRKNHARTRYWLWLLASMKFLLPFSLLVGLGSRIEWQSARAVVQPQLSVVVEQVSQPFLALQTPITSGPDHHVLPYFLMALWACGFLAISFSWWRRWRRVRAAVRDASPLLCIEKVPVVSSAALLEPGVFGIFRPVLLLPHGISSHLSPAQLEAVVAHELCHVRRRDNLAAALHMAVEAIFWFHPLVWWLGARLVEERECACDEEVLQRGNQPEVYAESILKTCQFYLEAPLTCMSGINGADLKSRIVRIMSQQMTVKLSFGRKVLLTAAGMAALAGPVWLGFIHPASSQAESRPSFEVASIKPNKSGDHEIRIENHPGRFKAKNVSLKFLVEFAYNLNDARLSGASGWIDSENYDIEANAAAVVAGEERQLLSDDELEQRRLMVRSLLAERFKLTLRQETKDLPVYALVVAKNGSKLQESAPIADDPSGPPRPRARGARFGRGELTMNYVPLSMLCDILSRQLGRPVVEKTGLTGNYDIKLKWTPEEGEGPVFKGPGDGARQSAPPPPEAAGPSIFTALQEQLGLRLESQKGPVEIFVIEHAERPSEN